MDEEWMSRGGVDEGRRSGWMEEEWMNGGRVDE